eukprot:10709530-Heterocapsa_arctica.AAC.1
MQTGDAMEQDGTELGKAESAAAATTPTESSEKMADAADESDGEACSEAEAAMKAATSWPSDSRGVMDTYDMSVDPADAMDDMSVQG